MQRITGERKIEETSPLVNRQFNFLDAAVPTIPSVNPNSITLHFDNHESYPPPVLSPAYSPSNSITIDLIVESPRSCLHIDIKRTFVLPLFGKHLIYSGLLIRWNRYRGRKNIGMEAAVGNKSRDKVAGGWINIKHPRCSCERGIFASKATNFCRVSTAPSARK